ncbi:MAG: hypothetical protein M1825_002786 [Sarcosagium campestre]|nr:MAG: hypothetical protein M1825_002786 [Sarcosagium campestre]
MQAPQGSQRSIPRRSPNPPEVSPATAAGSQSSGSVGGPTRDSSGSSRSQSGKRSNPSQQLSQIEKSVTHLLVATKQLLETLTHWSRHNATEGEVSDVYVRLGYEFNIASRAFNAIGVDTNDLGNVPDLLRSILEDTLSQEASPASLDRYLPRIRDIIINLLHGLKRKQQKLRQRQAKEDDPPLPGASSRQSRSGSPTGSEITLVDDQYRANGENTSTRVRSMTRDTVGREDLSIPARTSSAPDDNLMQDRQDSIRSASSKSRNFQESRDSSSVQRPAHTSSSSTAVSGTPTQSLPKVPSSASDSSPPITSEQGGTYLSVAPSTPATNGKQTDALAALQRGGDLERRASRRYSAYQISKHLGASPNGMPMLPPTQTTPVPNRGRDVRESMNAVRVRGSLLPNRSRPSNRFAGSPSPTRPDVAASQPSEGGSRLENISNSVPDINYGVDSPTTNKSGDRVPPAFELAGNESPVGELSAASPTLKRASHQDSAKGRDSPSDGYLTATSTGAEVRQFVPEQSPQPGKELTLFLQFKSKIKKIVLADGYNELSTARLQLAFIEKFAWNTHNNGNDLPDIYIQDPVSGVRHELEDLSDIKDRSVLVLNVEVLDEVKRHIDEGLGGLKKMVEGIRSVVDGQQASIQRVSDRQTDAAKDMARLAVTPTSASNRTSHVDQSWQTGSKAASTSLNRAGHLDEVQSLRRDLAVLRQTYASFVSDVQGSMADVRAKANAVKNVAMHTSVPSLDGDSGRAYVNQGKKELEDVSEALVTRVDDLQDIVEDLRKDVVTRGVRPLPRQLENVSRDISLATTELKKIQEFFRREKPKYTKIWEKELQVVCDDQDDLRMQEALATDLQDDLDNAARTFALVEEATKEQMKDGTTNPQRSASRGLKEVSVDPTADPHRVKEGVLGEVRALQPNHENRLEAIERAEKARRKELESRRGGEFQKELGSFVQESRLKKSGGVEETERSRKAKDDRIRREVWERQNARAASKEAATTAALPSAGETLGPSTFDSAAATQSPTPEVRPDDPAVEQSAGVTDGGDEGKDGGANRSSWLPSIFKT